MHNVKKVIQAMLAMQRSSWEQGIAAQSLYEYGDKKTMLLLAHEAVVRQQKDGRLGVMGENTEVNAPATNGEPVWRAYEMTKDSYYLNAANGMMEYLMMYAPRTEDGVIFHSTASKNKTFSNKQMWADGCYMVPPFLALMGEFTEATKQFGGYYNYLNNEATGLFYRAYDIGTGEFVQGQLWGAANGLVLLGTARMITEAVHQSEVEIGSDLADAGKALLDSLLRFQRDDGRFYNILDKVTSFIDGTTAMMAATFIYRGLAEGWLDDHYRAQADLSRDTMRKKVDDYGFVHEVCGAPSFEKPGTSVMAQAAYIMMEAWSAKAALA